MRTWGKYTDTLLTRTMLYTTRRAFLHELYLYLKGIS